jgi:hypothetical protein
MRLVTWNCCRRTYLKKTALLDALASDISVIQECARPSAETDHCLWFGDNPRQGVAVIANGVYRIRALPAEADVPRFSIPAARVHALKFRKVSEDFLSSRMPPGT